MQCRDGGTLLAGGTTAGGTLFTVGTTERYLHGAHDESMRTVCHKQKRTGAAEGPSARVLSKKTPPSCTSKVLPPIEGVGTFTGNGPPAVVPRNRVITVLGTSSTAKLTIYLSDVFFVEKSEKDAV